MMTGFTAWKPVPHPDWGTPVDLPVGPGVYAIRHASTGEMLAFGHSPNVAREVGSLLPLSGTSRWAPFAPRRLTVRSDELEYRSCAAASASDAKLLAERLRGRREVFWRRRMSASWA